MPTSKLTKLSLQQIPFLDSVNPAVHFCPESWIWCFGGLGRPYQVWPPLHSWLELRCLCHPQGLVEDAKQECGGDPGAAPGKWEGIRRAARRNQAWSSTSNYVFQLTPITFSKWCTHAIFPQHFGLLGVGDVKIVKERKCKMLHVYFHNGSQMFHSGSQMFQEGRGQAWFPIHAELPDLSPNGMPTSYETGPVANDGLDRDDGNWSWG